MNSKKIFLWGVILLIPCMIIGSAVLALFQNGFAATFQTQVLYIGDSGSALDALRLDDESMHIETQDFSNIDLSNINSFDVIFLNDANLTIYQLNQLSEWASIDGHGVIIIMGPTLTAGSEHLKTFGFTTHTQFQNNSGYIASSEELSAQKGLSAVNEDLDPSTSPILSLVWNSAPETFYFTQIPITNTSVQTYVKLQWMGNLSIEENKPLISGIQYGLNEGPNVYVFAGWFQNDFDNTDANEHMMVWPYFNYLIFASTQVSAGIAVPEYGKWDYSPVPHANEQIILGIIVLLTGVVSVWLYYKARNYKQKPHTIGSDLVEDQPTPEIEESLKKMDISEELSEEIDYKKQRKSRKEKKVEYVEADNDWEAVGFHRQISGFFKLFFVMILLLIPQLLVTSIIMPRFLNPYPQANGWYSYTLRFFEAIWLVFDMGFSFAITKYFAQHRIERPQKAYHYVQLFIWWEVLSGVVQLFMVAFLGAVIFPLTQFSYLSWMFVVHSLIQFPGIYLVFQYFFQGNQRADYHMIAFALQFFVLRLVLQVITVPIFRVIYANNVMYGAAFGAGIGLLVGQLLGDVALFGITWKMYQKLKLPITPIFLAEFTGEEFRETIKFGGKMVLGQVWVPAVWLLQVYLVGVYLPNSAAEQGYFELAFTISTIPQAVSLLMGAMLGGLTEAHEYKKKKLLNYTTFSGIKWGSIWTMFLVSVFWAIGPEFILGASGPNWVRAAALIPSLMFYRLLGPISWQADYEFAAANKPLYAGIAWIIEQSIRAILLFTLLPQLRIMEATIYAYIISLAIKDVIVLIFMRKKIHKWDWNLWQSFIAPALAAFINYGILRLIVYLLVDLWLGIGIISAMILFIIGLFCMEFIYSFFVGLFGGYDTNTMTELNRATAMVTGVRPLARGYYKMAAWGAKISPLHDKFKVRVFEEAQKEAEEITRIKKKIVF